MGRSPQWHDRHAAHRLLLRSRPALCCFRQKGREDTLIHVIAIITTKPGQRDTVLQAFNANVPAVHAENGCIEYGATVDSEGLGSFQTKFGADTFVVVEKWESIDALKAHSAAPHMAAYAGQVKDMLAGRVIHVLSPA